jgi:3-oxoacyl-[acyl-carrier-protein] synthase-3
MASTGIIGVGGYVPDRIIENAEIAEFLPVDENWISDRTGIFSRHAAAPHEAASDLAAIAAERALDDAGLNAADIDLIIVATSTPDELGPSTACRVQALLGAERAVAFDVAAACAGWMFAMQVAQAHLALDLSMRYVLVIGVEVYSRFVSSKDRATVVLFGDGAGATVIGRVPSPYGIDHVSLGSDGTKADYVLIPGGGSRRPATEQTLKEGAHRVKMNAEGVRKFIAARFPDLIAQTLEAASLKVDEVTLLVAHQPNPKLVESLAVAAGLRPDQVVLTSSEVGNIGAASIPYALARAVETGRLHIGDTVVTVTIGAGMTWGRALLTWAPRLSELENVV